MAPKSCLNLAMSQPGLFDISDRLEQLSRKGDSLVRLNEVIDWNDFQPLL